MQRWKLTAIIAPIVIAMAGCLNKSMSPPVADPGQGVLQGKVTRGPMRPMLQSGQAAPAGGGVAAAQIDIVNRSSGKLASSLKTDANGRYSVNLPPGTYVVTMPPGSLYSRDLPATVTLAAGHTQALDIHLDTGIR